MLGLCVVAPASSKLWSWKKFHTALKCWRAKKVAECFIPFYVTFLSESSHSGGHYCFQNLDLACVHTLCMCVWVWRIHVEIVELLPGVQFAFHLTGAKSLSSRLHAVYSRLAGSGTSHWFPGLHLPSRYSSPGISAERNISSLLCECRRPNSGCQACSASKFTNRSLLLAQWTSFFTAWLGFPWCVRIWLAQGNRVSLCLEAGLLFHRLWIDTWKLPLLFHDTCDQSRKSDAGPPLALFVH